MWCGLFDKKKRKRNKHKKTKERRRSVSSGLATSNTESLVRRKRNAKKTIGGVCRLMVYGCVCIVCVS